MHDASRFLDADQFHDAEALPAGVPTAETQSQAPQQATDQPPQD